jgi:hypothetical protein
VFLNNQRQKKYMFKKVSYSICKRPNLNLIINRLSSRLRMREALLYYAISFKVSVFRNRHAYSMFCL